MKFNFFADKVKNRRRRAALLAGATLLSAPACGKKDIEKNPEPGASISIEEDTTKKKNNIETTVENMIEGKTTGENNGTEENTYVDNGNGYTEYSDPTEENTEEQTEEKTEGKTEVKTEAKTEGKTTVVDVKNPNEHKVGNSSPEKHTEPTTQKPTTNKTTTAAKNNNTKVTTTTKKVTTTAKPTTKKVTTTTKVVTTTAKPTTQKPTEPPTTQPPAPTYDYTLENITQSAEVFNYFAEKMNLEIFRGRSVTTIDFNGENHCYDGVMESKVALLLLNENANFKDGVLRDIFAGYNNESIKEGIYYCNLIPMFEEVCNGYVDFNKYVLDQNIGDYMNMLEEAKKNGAETGDYSELNNILEDSIYNGQYDYAANNMASLYYTLGVGVYCPGSEYKEACTGVINNGNFCGRQSQTENKVKELLRW